MIEFIESYIELQLNIFSENRTKFVAFQLITTEFRLAFYALSCERVGT